MLKSTRIISTCLVAMTFQSAFSQEIVYKNPSNGTRYIKETGEIAPNTIYSKDAFENENHFPFYMQFPTSASVNFESDLKPAIQKNKKRWKFINFKNNDSETYQNLGLNLFVFDNGTPDNNGLNAYLDQNEGYSKGYSRIERAQERKAKKIQELAQDGVLRTGDVVLSYRLAYAKTIPYSHLQLGVSHAGLIFVEEQDSKKVAYNIDMPLNGEYNSSYKHAGRNTIDSQLNSTHYTETPYVHIIRSKRFDNAQARKNLLDWVKVVKRNVNSFYGNNTGFNSDYLSSNYDRLSKEIVAGGDSNKTFLNVFRDVIEQTGSYKNEKFNMFCSEFVWAMMSLANCAPKDKSCVPQDIFKPVNLFSKPDGTPGLLEAPWKILENSGLASSTEKANEYIKDSNDQHLFFMGKAEGLSSGHKAVANNPIMGFITGMAQIYYQFKAAQVNVPALKFEMVAASHVNAVITQSNQMLKDMITKAKSPEKEMMQQFSGLLTMFEGKISTEAEFKNFMNLTSVDTYSPSAFILQTLTEKSGFEYVGTIAFVDSLKSHFIKYQNRNADTIFDTEYVD